MLARDAKLERLNYDIVDLAPWRMARSATHLSEPGPAGRMAPSSTEGRPISTNPKTEPAVWSCTFSNSGPKVAKPVGNSKT
jgi:hypothetical protein